MFPLFGRATITLGIGPHSSSLLSTRCMFIICRWRYVNEVISKTTDDKINKESLVVALLILLNAGLIIVDRILLGLHLEPTYTSLILWLMVTLSDLWSTVVVLVLTVPLCKLLSRHTCESVTVYHYVVLVWGQRCSAAGKFNYRSDIPLAMCHRFSGVPTYRLSAPGRNDKLQLKRLLSSRWIDIKDNCSLLDMVLFLLI